MKKPKMILAILSVLMAIAFLNLFPTKTQAASEPAKGISVDYHSQADIKKMWKDLNLSMSKETTYAKQPVLTPPYDPGALSKESTQDALNMFNMMRYIAGIPYDLQVYDEYQEKAQAAALIMTINNKLSHTQQTPAGMSEELRYTAGDGLGSSALCGGGNIYSAAPGLVDDTWEVGTDVLGHRRWMLNPEMQYTGFGACENSKGGYGYCAIYVANRDNEDAAEKYKGVAWPAQNTPLEYFYDLTKWSISLGEDLTDEQADSIAVTLKRTSDGKTWKFSKNAADGYYKLSIGGYGQEGACIIFKPSDDITYQEGDQFKVSIKGKDLDISYTVNFFWIHSHNYENHYTIDEYPDCVTDGSKSRHCSVKGCRAKTDARTIPATGHNYQKPKFTWTGTSKCSAKFTCKGWEFTEDNGEIVGGYCPDDPKTVSCSITSDITKATLTANGKKTYTASCALGGKHYTDTKSSTIYHPETFKLSKTSLTYTGKAQKVSVSVKDSKGKKISSSHYTVSGNKGKAVGRHTVTVTFKGDKYKGTKTLAYNIKPKAPALSKVTPAKKAFTAQWTKQSGSGYQIQVATNSGFKSAKAVTVKGSSAVSKKVSDLKANTKYYVHVRTYKTVKVDGKTTKLTSTWSAAKTVTTKK